MRSSTRLDSAVFQLTPTRTRCKFVVFANGKSVQIAHGIVAPFIEHLKTAKDQLAKGGYSIILEPEPGTEAAWFTMETIQRFVRFVLTPEVLERVQSLELEIVQIEEAIAMQASNDTDDSNAKPKSTKQNEGTKPQLSSNEEKSIILYEPGATPNSSHESSEEERNSKIQLMKVLESRKNMLQKEQGMAFARATAAGFDIDHLNHLMLFAECFGAKRLMDGCTRFRDLWRRKHETGQWLEIDAAEALASRSDMPAMNSSGIILSSPMTKQWPPEGADNGKPNDDAASEWKPPADQQASFGHPEYYHGQYPPPMYPTWPMHPPPGVFPGYSMQGVPYFQNYPGNAPFYNPQSYHGSGDDPRFVNGQSARRRRHSMDGGEDDDEDAESWEGGPTKPRSQDDADLDHQSSGNYESRRRGSRSGKKKSGMVVIKNVNYFTSNREASVDGNMESDSGSEVEDGRGSTNRRGDYMRSSKERDVDPINEERSVNKKGGGGGQWDAFQSFLLNIADKAEQGDKNGMFLMENEARTRKQSSSVDDDPLSYGGRKALDAGEHELDLQSAESNGRKNIHRSNGDDCVIGGSQNRTGSLFEPVDVNKYERELPTDSVHVTEDNSFLVSMGANSVSKGGSGQAYSMDMVSEFSSGVHKAGGQSNYEPDELSLMPKRGAERESAGYDPAFDFSMQALATGKTEEIVDSDESPQKIDKDAKPSMASKTLGKKNVSQVRRGKPSKLSPVDEAKARAERLRNYKADLQKLKKEKEEEQIKRLEALKLERQKRIAARSGSGSSPSPAQSKKKPSPVKLSPSSHGGSKFSDTGPGLSSPLQRSSVRSLPPEPQVLVKSSVERESGKQKPGNRLSQSVPSLPEALKENDAVATEPKASMLNLRRLSEPKVSGGTAGSAIKTRKIESSSKTKPPPESKKISAIIHHDKHKAASLPELKIKSAKVSDTVKGKSLSKAITVKASNSDVLSTSPVAEVCNVADMALGQSSGDEENAVIERTLVMLEPEHPHASSENVGHLQSSCSLSEEDIGTLDDYAAKHLPTSAFSMDGVDPVEVKPNIEVPIKPNIEVPISGSVMPYVAPYARVSAMDDSSIRSSENVKSNPSSLQTLAPGVDSQQPHVNGSQSFKLDKIPESTEKPKESSKGFRRLLKFGRKSHHTDHASEADNLSASGSEPDDATNSAEAHTLKNLISQDEGAAHKSSRHFSILSPFRSKSSDKKQTA